MLINFSSVCEFVNSLKLLSLRLDYKICTVLVTLEQQCKEIKQAVSLGKTGDDIGAEDQVIPGTYSNLV